MLNNCKFHCEQIDITVSRCCHWTCWPSVPFFLSSPLMFAPFVMTTTLIIGLSPSLIANIRFIFVRNWIGRSAAKDRNKEGRDEAFFLKGVQNLGKLYDFDGSESFDFLGFQHIVDQLDDGFDVASKLEAVSYIVYFTSLVYFTAWVLILGVANGIAILFKFLLFIRIKLSYFCAYHTKIVPLDFKFFV